MMRYKANEILHGVDMEQYNNVRDYANVLLTHNPRSSITTQVFRQGEEVGNGFQRMFYSLGTKEGLVYSWVQANNWVGWLFLEKSIWWSNPNYNRKGQK